MLLQLKDKNQLTLPKEIIDALNLRKNDTLNVVLDGNKIVITPLSVLETELLTELKEAFDNIEEGKIKSYDSVDDLFKDLDA
jgi:AbrB family looped-hinge helix DNA binding protein